MAEPVIASSTTDTTGGTQGTSLSFTEPSGLAADDLILVVVADENADTQEWAAITTPDAYTQIAHGDNSGDVHASIYWRIADDTETWPLTVSGVTSDYRVGWCFRITGVDTTTPINQTGTWAGVGSVNNPLNVTGVTPDVADCLGFAMCATDGSDIAPTTVSGAGWSSATSLEDPSNNSSGVAADYSTKSLTKDVASGTCTFTPSATDGIVGIQIAIAPSAGVTITDVANSGETPGSGSESWDDGDTGNVITGTGFV